MEEEKSKGNIAILSDSALITTGYSNQAKTLANILVDEGYDVYFFGSNYIGQNLKPPITFEDGRKLNFKLIGQGREPYFKDLMSKYLKDYKIDIFIILLDTFMLHGGNAWFLDIDTSPAKTIFWFPSDGGGGLPLGCELILKKIDLPIAMAKFGQQQVKKCHDVNTEYIPHALNMDYFFRLNDEERKKLKKHAGLENKFVIGVVARNQGRKFLDRTIKFMAEYAKINPNAMLLLHLDPNDPAQPFPILSLIQRYGIENRVLFTGTTYFRGFDDKKMKEVYNIMDCFLLTTSGEGFGIPIIEAMACEVPVIATNYTTTPELVIQNNAGLGIDLVGTEVEEHEWLHGSEILEGTITGSWSVERGICSIKDAVKKVDYIFKNQEEAKKMGENGRKAVLRDYDWNVTKKKWIELIENLNKKY